MTEFSERLREKFAATGWDVAELVRRTKLSRGAVSRHLNGRATPHYAIRQIYADVFGVPVEELSRPDTPITLSPELSATVREYAAYEGREPLDWLEFAIREAASTPTRRPKGKVRRQSVNRRLSQGEGQESAAGGTVH